MGLSEESTTVVGIQLFASGASHGAVRRIHHCGGHPIVCERCKPWGCQKNPPLWWASNCLRAVQAMGLSEESTTVVGIQLFASGASDGAVRRIHHCGGHPIVCERCKRWGCQ